MNCPVCEQPVPPALGTRPRVYCSLRCKSRAHKKRVRDTWAEGAYRRGGEREKWCKNKRHLITEKHQRVFVGTYFEQCKRCYLLRRRSERTTRKGYCRKNLHVMEGANVGYRGDTDTQFCKACRAIQRRESRKMRREVLGYRDVRCPVNGCSTGVQRSPLNTMPYYCPRHRHQAPLWLRAAMGERAA